MNDGLSLKGADFIIQCTFQKDDRAVKDATRPYGCGQQNK